MDLKRNLFTYYDQRAEEYDDLYLRGTGSGRPALHVRETADLSRLVGRLSGRHIIDVPSGAGYWMQFYGNGCDRITLVDQSDRMLSECVRKAEEWGLARKISTLRADVLEADMGGPVNDVALVGYLLGHLEDADIARFLGQLRAALIPGSPFLVLESAFAGARVERGKQGVHQRTLRDGSRHHIFKRYFGPADFVEVGRANGASFEVVYEGEVYIAARGRFT